MKEAQANLFLRIMHNHSRDLTPFIYELRELKKHSPVELVKNPTLWSAVLYWGLLKKVMNFGSRPVLKMGWSEKLQGKRSYRCF